MKKHNPNDPFCECFECTFGVCDAYITLKNSCESVKSKKFISIPNDRLEEIHVNQIQVDQLSENDKKLLFQDVYGALDDAEKERYNYTGINDMSNL